MIPLTDYLQTLVSASNMAWKIFKSAVITGSNPSRAFQQLCEQYKDTYAEQYVVEYTKCCMKEIGRIVDMGSTERSKYIQDANKSTGEMWSLFKQYAEKIYADTMTEQDWSDVAHCASLIGLREQYASLYGYTQGYTLLCVFELDRLQRKMLGISDDMVLSEYMVGRKVQNE